MTRYPKAGKGRPWTARELMALPADWKGDTLSDGNGLSGEVRVAQDGQVSVRFKYAFRWQGAVCWYQCGTWPSVDLAEIRRLRDKARVQLAEGINPNAAKESARIERQRVINESLARAEAERRAKLAVDDLFMAWLADGVNRSDGNKELRRIYTQDIQPNIGRLELRDLTESHIRGMLKSEIGVGKVRKAQVMLLSIKQALHWAEKRQPWRALLLEGNPADLVTEDSITPPDHEDERDRVLSPAEIYELAQIFERTVAAYDEAQPGAKLHHARPLKLQSRLALWIALGTICRIGELLMARWEDVDLKAGTWFIPEANVKGRRGKKQAHLVYLSPFVLRQFQQLHALTGKSEWCFPAKSPVSGAPHSHVSVNSVTKQVGDRQAMFMQRKPLKNRRNDNTLVLSEGRNGNWTPHDLRRTGATMMQSMGIPLDTIDRCQNHVLGGSKTRRHYLHHDYADEKADAWLKLGERLNAILAGGIEAHQTPPRA